MNPLSIKLRIGETEKTFMATEIKGRMLRKAIEFQSLKESAFTVDTLDSMVNFVVEVFENKFTLDDVYDGIKIEDIMPEMMRCVQEVIQRFGSKMEQFPNGQPASR